MLVPSGLGVCGESLAEIGLADAAKPSSSWRWKQDDGVVGLLDGDCTLWQFNFDWKNSKAYFHPIALTSGPVLTADRPADHLWHHGMWFSWKYINHVNYWEENRDTGQSEGRTTWSNVRIDLRDDFSARIKMDLAYVDPSGVTVMTEKRTIDITCPDDEGMYSFDWECDFTAQDDSLNLGRTPTLDEPDGKAWGGYAGLSVRFAVGMESQQLRTGTDVAHFQKGRYRGKSFALDYSGVIDEKSVGVAVLNCYQNLTHPTSWYADASATMSYLSPAVLYEGPLQLSAGDTLKTRYRVMIHSGIWESDRLHQEYRTYTQEYGGSVQSQPQLSATGDNE
ncbi:hypothetical protein RRSWK_06357 [Rhodopirellula sp. SWK7]|nr:hypothetical protein RRSWK_06357 [Rhodopirellula sp. SWK7]